VERSDGSFEYVSVTQIYATDLRAGWVRFMAHCKGDEHEIHALKSLPMESLKMGGTAGTICIYDRAGIDLVWWCDGFEDQRALSGFLVNSVPSSV
jgi:hypothetical protein